MSESNKRPEVSMSGDPILRHKKAADWQFPHGEPCTEEISNHIEAHLGQIELVFHEIVSDTVHIDVNRVGPTDEFPVFRLVTSGMSDLPMSVPPKVDGPRFVELMITLPGDWKLDEDSLKNEAWYWPIRLIKKLALLPHKYGTWLGRGHTVPNGDPAEPYAHNTKFTGAIILPSVSVADSFHTLTINARKVIHFFAVAPLYEEEMNLKLRSGVNTLLNKLGKAKINEIVDISRSNVARKRFGFF